MARLKYQLVFAAAILFSRSAAAATDPITGSPYIERNLEPYCETELIPADTLLTCYNLVVRKSYSIKCAASFSHWDKVVLDVFGTIQPSVQFDRYGGLWLGEVELLRTTTPEPISLTSIAWSIERDVTVYQTLFVQEGINASLTIPNVVCDQYNGVLNMSAKLSFYKEEAIEDLIGMAAVSSPVVYPVTAGVSEYPWEAIQVTGEDIQQNTVRLPFRDTQSAFLVVHASPHQDEEFWWSCLPSNLVDEVGGCGGGAVRELVVTVDGLTAGVALPYPIMYTGGVNPLLWQPLTGIMSFDVEPWTFDLTPFVGLLNDGGNHLIGLQVVGSAGALWYLDASLLLYRNEAGSTVLGSVISVEDPPMSIDTTISRDPHRYDYVNVTTRAARQVRIRGTVGELSVEIIHDLSAVNFNKVLGDATSNTEVVSYTNATVAVREESAAKTQYRRQMFDSHEAKFRIWSQYSEANAANATMSRTRRRVMKDTTDGVVRKSRDSGANELDAFWNNRMDGFAIYNSSYRSSAMSERFVAKNGRTRCFDRMIEALDGAVVRDVGAGTDSGCSWPKGVAFNGGSELTLTPILYMTVPKIVSYIDEGKPSTTPNTTPLSKSAVANEARRVSDAFLRHQSGLIKLHHMEQSLQSWPPLPLRRARRAMKEFTPHSDIYFPIGCRIQNASAYNVVVHSCALERH